jgi:hypothetical protein
MIASKSFAINYIYSVERKTGLFSLRLKCALHVVALSEAIIRQVNTKVV